MSIDQGGTWPSPVTHAPDLGHEPPEWTYAAVCQSVDPELFFPEKGGTTRPAKLVCSGCPVILECLAYALIGEERFGIWGGLSERERRRLPRDGRAGIVARATVTRMVGGLTCPNCGRGNLRSVAIHQARSHCTRGAA